MTTAVQLQWPRGGGNISSQFSIRKEHSTEPNSNPFGLPPSLRPHNQNPPAITHANISMKSQHLFTTSSSFSTSHSFNRVGRKVSSLRVLTSGTNQNISAPHLGLCEHDGTKGTHPASDVQMRRLTLGLLPCRDDCRVFGVFC